MKRTETHSDAAIAVGIDIGGTSTKLGLVTRSGEILYRASLLTPHELHGEEILQSIIARLDELIQWSAMAGSPPSRHRDQYLRLSGCDG